MHQNKQFNNGECCPTPKPWNVNVKYIYILSIFFVLSDLGKPLFEMCCFPITFALDNES